MSGKVGSKCGEVGCFAMVVPPARFCASHKRSASSHITSAKPRLELYNTAAWKQTRIAYLARHPLCNRCGDAASIVHHIKGAREHVEDRLNWNNLEALCFNCHQSETAGEIQVRRLSLGLPVGRRFACATTAIVGPPGGGKTTLATKSAGSGDVVIDLDLLSLALTTNAMYGRNRSLLSYLLTVRRAAIEALMVQPCAVVHAWLVFTAPLRRQREELAEAGAEVLMLNPGREECYARIAADTRRSAGVEAQLQLVDDWFDEFEADGGASHPSNQF